jgi:hypothetical protein
MIKFDDYRGKYSHIRMERQGGILQITFHTEGASLKWSGPSHEQLGYAFADIARDQENRVVIMTGAGDAFSRRRPRLHFVKEPVADENGRSFRAISVTRDPVADL